MEVSGLLYHRVSSAQYPLDRRLGGPQCWSASCGKENLSPLPGIKPRVLCHPACSLVTVLSYPGFEVDEEFRTLLYLFTIYAPLLLKNKYQGKFTLENISPKCNSNEIGIL
jgi:hypothetical protein